MKRQIIGTEIYPKEPQILQTTTAPLQTLEDINLYIEVQQADSDWDYAVLLTDKKSVVIALCVDKHDIVQVIRICLAEEDEIIQALKALNKGNTRLLCCEARDEVARIDCAEVIFNAIENSTSQKKTLARAVKYFEHKPRGRGQPITANIARDVVFESHGYCMFEGCGDHLGVDRLTGIKGNFRYLAHIVASSPDGPRGNQRSHELSNDPKNIMVLCDKHHRLIDKVAVDEYDESRLRGMRTEFTTNSDCLLQSLAYQPVTTFTALWPIGNFVTEGPSPQEYAISLKPVHCRPSGRPLSLIHRTSEAPADDQWWETIVPREINHVGNKFLGYDANDRRQAGLYAMGPSSTLIGLGAILGNKSNLCVVPKSRKNGWGWERSEPIEQPFSVSGLDNIDGPIEELAVTLFLTAIPAENQQVLDYLKTKNINCIHITPKFFGNTCLAHPHEGAALREMFLELLHHLRNKFHVKRVHLLHCAPNAACVEVGRAIEHNHPSIRIYDHCKSGDEKYMVPRLDLIPSRDQVEVCGTPNNEVIPFHQHFQTATE